MSRGEDSDLRIAIINDRPVVVAGLARMLREHGANIDVAGIEIGGSDSPPVDIALFDLAFGDDILDRAEELRERGLADKLVVYAWDASEELLERVRNDPDAYLIPKSISGDELVSLLQSIHDEEVDEDVFAPIDTIMPGAPSDLSPREVDVVVGVANGRSNREIAQDLGLSENTVKTYVARTMDKLAVNRRSSIAAWAAHHGLVRVD